MKVLGLLGGMSWESTAEYHRLVNEEARSRVGGLHSAPLLLWSADFAEIEALAVAGRWDEAGTRFVGVIDRLAAGGARGVVLGCTQIELHVRRGNTTVPVFPSTARHARSAVQAAVR